MAAMLVVKNNSLSLRWEMKFIFMQILRKKLYCIDHQNMAALSREIEEYLHYELEINKEKKKIAIYIHIFRLLLTFAVNNSQLTIFISPLWINDSVIINLMTFWFQRGLIFSAWFT